MVEIARAGRRDDAVKEGPRKVGANQAVAEEVVATGIAQVLRSALEGGAELGDGEIGRAEVAKEQPRDAGDVGRGHRGAVEEGVGIGTGNEPLCDADRDAADGLEFIAIALRDGHDRHGGTAIEGSRETPPALLEMMTPMAPAAMALSVFSRKESVLPVAVLVPARRMWAIWPATEGGKSAGLPTLQ